ncbi:HD domain-containing protein [Candidatus Cardinium hertigii]|uniref:HD domain-containing protein n=1 Tax=Candidatus Cardinium hertigii TaxID=247481 RepID=UPI003D7DF838
MKKKLVKLQGYNTVIGYTGCYVIITTAALSYVGQGLAYWYILQIAAGIWLIGYSVVSHSQAPSWEITRSWLIGVMFCLPINVVWHWWHVTDYLFLLKLSLAHLSVALFVFPLSLGMIALAVTLSAIVYISCFVDNLIELTDDMVVLFGFSILVFTMIIYCKVQIADYSAHSHCLKDKKKLEAKKNYKLKLKQMIHNLHMRAKKPYSKRDSSFLDKIVEIVMESPLFLEDDALYKEDFNIIVNKFIAWSIFLKEHTKSKVHLPLLPTEISLNELIQELEIRLNGSVESAPGLIISAEHIDMSAKIVCDVSQVIDLLETVVLRITHLKQSTSIRIQLHTTRLKYYKYCPIKKQKPPEISFPAIALVVSTADTPLSKIPSIKSYYHDITEGIELIGALNQSSSERINVQKEPIERNIRAHYGYLQPSTSKQKTTLLVLPYNVRVVQDGMLTNLVPSNSYVNKSEIDTSMEVLMKFNDYACKMCNIRIGVMDEIFLLLRRCYAFRRHASGKLFYVRAVGIARLVTDWVNYKAEPIYAALLYDLVVYTDLPISYIKANYSLAIFSFVQSIISIENRKDLEPSVLCIDNQRKKIVNQDQLFILCIKLAERLYDLRQAYGYTHKIQISNMAKETLTVDICLAKKYLDNDVVEALERAAQEALKI